MLQGPPDKYKPCILNIFIMAYCTIHGGAHISARELMRYGTVREPWPTMKDHRYEQYVATYITCTKAQARGSCIDTTNTAATNKATTQGCTKLQSAASPTPVNLHGRSDSCCWHPASSVRVGSKLHQPTRQMYTVVHTLAGCTTVVHNTPAAAPTLSVKKQITWELRCCSPLLLVVRQQQQHLPSCTRV